MSGIWDTVQAWDEALFLRLHGWLHDLPEGLGEVKTLLRAANELGTGWVLLPVTILALVLEPRVGRALRRVAEVGLSLGLAGWAGHQLRHAIGRPRPLEALPEAFAHGRARIYFDQVMHSNSWPSGHAAGAFALATVLWVWAGAIDGRWRRALARTAALAGATGTALARVYAGVHFPLDLVGGAVLGVLAAVLVLAIARAVLGPWVSPPPAGGPVPSRAGGSGGAPS